MSADETSPRHRRKGHRRDEYDGQIRRAVEQGNPQEAMKRGFAHVLGESRKLERLRPFDAELTEMRITGLFERLAMEIPDQHPWRPSRGAPRPAISDLLQAYEEGFAQDDAE